MTPEAEIRRRIAERGSIPFAEFMEVALYNPTGGYYTSGERVGTTGDFYTSPEVHPAFGTLLSVQLFQMWQLLDRPEPFTVVEPGAGNGLLCRDILAAARGLPEEFARNLLYVCLDRRRNSGFERGLPGAARIAASDLPLRRIVGCVLSNELLDAMPVHQVTKENGRLLEVYVTPADDGFTVTTGEPSSPLLEQRLARLGIELADGQTAEVNLALEHWVASAAESLERGFVLTVDYGRTAEELYSPADRFRGTLTTFHDHLQTDRPLERIGRQDMSAQVDFTTLAKAGTQVGLDILGYDSQAAFLHNLGLEVLERRPGLAPPRQALASRVGMRELAKPGGLGDFKVMAQGKNVGEPHLWGFRASGQATDLVAGMPSPTSKPEHLDLMPDRRPQMEVEFEMEWDSLWDGDLSTP